jgi:hypothetical protein
MLFFGLSFAAGILALLAVQKMDVECANPPKAPRAPRAKSASRASANILSGAVYLQQQ